MLPKPSAGNQFKYLKYNFNLMNAFPLKLLIYFLASRFNILRMSLYKSMKPFQDNLEEVIKKYFCSFHYSLTGTESTSNKKVLIGMRKYNSSCNYYF